ncbi:MAG TPA: glycosyl hydrolase, partial [Burkholderiales bacterium]|nr:glycosyl hydrolase [Burkholderiales bacterium]
MLPNALFSPLQAIVRCKIKKAVLCIFAGALSFSASAGIKFGANGHVGEYPLATLEEQFNLLKDLGAKSYRLDVYGYETGGMNALRSAITYAQDRDIDVLPVLVVKPNSSESPQQHYTRAYDLGYGVASRLKAYNIKVYELGNELDSYALINPCETRDNGFVWPCGYGAASGADKLDYKASRFAQVKAIIEGLGDGIRAAIHDAQRIVSTAGWLHYGFLQRLLNEGVDYDITGYHWYSDHGDMENAEGKNVLQILANMGKPIWITEYNRRYGSYDNKNTEQSEYVEQMMARLKEVATLYNVQMAHVYVIMDRPWMTGTIAHYGVVEMKQNSSDAWVPATKKPAYYAFKRQATNSTTPISDLVPTAFTVPSNVPAGTPIIFKASVKNNGTKTVPA